MKLLLLVLISFISLAQGQEQLALRINENGLMKVMQLALKYNTGVANSRTVVVPENIYKFTIKQQDLASNPIVRVFNEITDLNLQKDLDFYLKTADIKITGVVDSKSLSTEITNSHQNGFDLKLSIKLNKITVNSSSLTLCEKHLKNTNKCAKGLKTTATGLRLSTYGKPVILSSIMRLTIKNGVAKVKILSVNSNLEGKNAPTLDVNFSTLEVPRIAIVIDGQETELDTSKLRNEILERKNFLGQKLLGFSGEFIANDLAEMINIYLANTQIATNIQVYRRQPVSAQRPKREFEYHDPNIQLRDNTYVRPYVAVRDNTYVKPAALPVYNAKPAGDVMKVLLDQFAEVIRHAQVDLSLRTIKTPSNKDVELTGLLNFVLNYTTFRVGSTLGNSSRKLPALDLSPYRSHDLNLAISEPVINGALDLANSTGLFNEVLEEITDLDALSLNSLKLHFTNSNSLKVVANVAIDLKKMRTSIWTDPKAWAETEIGIFLERNNNNSVIYFPIEIEVIPVVKTNATTGEASLAIKLKSAFNGSYLLNTYNYPSNVGNMFQIVRKAVLGKLHEQLDQYADKEFSVDLTKYLNQSGVEFLPKSIVFNQSAYLLLNLDIKQIKFDSLNPTKK